jgi:hypothetical protein
MASILPTTTTVPHALHLPPPAASEEDEPFVIPELGKISGPIRQLIEQRLSWGAGKQDEVWEGVYHMSQDPNPDHQDLVLFLQSALHAIAQELAGRATLGTNITDRTCGWVKNFRCPDVIVLMPNGKAQRFKSGYVGGPDIAVEILSPDDESVEKLPFYAAIGTREVLHVDTDTKELTLFTLRDGSMQVVGTSSVSDSNVVASAVLPVSFQVLGEPAKPLLRVTHTAKPELRWEL